MFVARFLLLVAAAKCSIYSDVGELTNTYARGSSDVAILMLSNPASRELTSWLQEFRKPVQVWTRIGETQLQQLQSRTKQNGQSVVVVPFSSEPQRRQLFTQLDDHIETLELVRLIFVLGSDEELPYPEYPKVSCIVVSVNQSGIDAPLDDYSDCTRRKVMPVTDLPKKAPKALWKDLKGKKITAATSFYYKESGIVYSASNYSECRALLRAFQTCNMTVTTYEQEGSGSDMREMFVLARRKMYEIWLLRGLVRENESALVDLGAISTYQPLMFYSRKGVKVAPRSMQSMAVPGITVLLVVLGGVSVGLLYSLQGPLLVRRVQMSGIVLFLISNLVGKGFPLPVSSEHMVTRILCISWMLGMIWFANYLQSEFTSEMAAPPVYRKIATVDDLLNLMRTREVLPCTVRHGQVQMFIFASSFGLFATLKRVMQQNPENCLRLRHECLALASAGTHVYIEPNDPGFLPIPPELQLSLSEDHFDTAFCAPVTAKSFPFKGALRHLTTRLFETGAIYFEERQMARERSFNYTEELGEFSHEFSLIDHCILYACGILAAGLALLCEIVFAIKRKRTNRLPYRY